MRNIAITCIALLAAHTAQAASFQTLYSFAGGNDGSGPYGKLVMDKAGILYGVTVSGGAGGRGVIYSLKPGDAAPTTLYSFTGGADGANPQSTLSLDAKGNLYGVTPTGGLAGTCSSGCGTIFKLNIAAGTFTTLYRFTGLADGAQPIAPPLLSGGHLYGSTTYGGTDTSCGTLKCGTLYNFSLASQSLAVMRELARADGVGAEGKMAVGPGGLLYGAAGEAGVNGSGNDFSINPATGAYTVVHGFDYHVDGAYSDADLVIKKGVIYGTERAGGPTSANDGTVYRLDSGTGALTTLYSFQGGADGLFPTDGVVFGAHGLLYGVTSQGGASGAGTIYSVSPTKLVFTTLRQFSGSDGSQPAGALLPAKGGPLYGTTSGGGRGHGTVFEIMP